MDTFLELWCVCVLAPASLLDVLFCGASVFGRGHAQRVRSSFVVCGFSLVAGGTACVRRVFLQHFMLAWNQASMPLDRRTLSPVSERWGALGELEVSGTPWLLPFLGVEVFFWRRVVQLCRSEGFPRTRITKSSCACDCGRGLVSSFFFFLVLPSSFLPFFLFSSFFFSHPVSCLKIKIF